MFPLLLLFAIKRKQAACQKWKRTKKSRQPLGRSFSGNPGKNIKKRLVVKKFTTRRWDKLDDKGKIRQANRLKPLKDGESFGGEKIHRMW